MSDEHAPAVPVWALSTSDARSLPALTGEGALTPERLSELRSALATLSTVPIVTLEAHPLPRNGRLATGLRLDAVSPLAQELSRLVAANAKTTPAVAQLVGSGEVLYRMVVPAKVAAQVGKGLVRSMPSKAVANGVYDNLVDTSTNLIAAKASFVPVQAAAAGAGGTAVGTVAAGTAMTVAAPLILMAVAVGASAYADHQRQQATEHIAELLQKLHDDRLEQERNELDGCRDAIDKATALLLDRGRVGASLGLDSAVYAISTATENAVRRVQRWEAALDAMAGNRVEVADLEAAFPGVSDEGGEFRAHVEMAALAIALKRRVIVLQGVEAGQSSPDNPFENFVRSLRADQQRIDDLEARIRNTLVRLSALELRSPKRLIDNGDDSGGRWTVSPSHDQSLRPCGSGLGLSARRTSS
jgi:hypothetical protein